MTHLATESVLRHSPLPAARSKTDPILLELWEIKRQLNEGAHYDIAELARRASAFDLDAAMKRLGVAPNQPRNDVKLLSNADKADGTSAP